VRCADHGRLIDAICQRGSDLDHRLPDCDGLHARGVRPGRPECLALAAVVSAPALGRAGQWVVGRD